MILQENEFLKLYNEMDRLWEEVDTKKSSSRTNKEDFTFGQVVEYAKTDSKKLDSQGLTLTEVQYWQNIRFLLEQKQLRLGDVESAGWVERFMRFYKAYKIEEAFLNWLEKNGFSGSEFGDGANHKVLTSDDEVSVVPDIKLSTGVTIECKSRTLRANIHGADLVARHDLFKNTVSGRVLVRFWIVSRTNSGLASKVFKTFNTCERDSLTQPFAIQNQKPTGTLEVEMPQIYTWLNMIDSYLLQNNTAKDIRTTQLLDGQAKALAGTIQALDLPVKSDTTTASANPAEAASQLADLAVDLADTLNQVNK